MSRVGKIARLPKAVQEELNQRLENHELGSRLLAWLNSLPETHAILQEFFHGVPISKQNLSEWQHGGYREWQDQQDALKVMGGMTSDADELQPTTAVTLTDKLAPWLVARYFMKVKSILAAGGSQKELDLLHDFCGDVVALRRSDHSSARLRLAQERLSRELEQSEEGIVQYFYDWARNPEISEWIRDNTLSEEEKRQRLLEIFGRTEEPESVENQAQSNLVKPNQT